jgi:predicted small lipoprotein YifL
MSNSPFPLPSRRALLAAAVAAVALAACGKKGPLEPAPGSRDALAADAAKKANANQPQTDLTPQVGVRRGRRPPPVSAPKGEPFLLDFLL